MEEESYRITPLGVFASEMTLAKANSLEKAIIKWMKRAGENALVIEDEHLHWATLTKEWD